MTFRLVMRVGLSGTLALNLSACAALSGGDAKGAQELFAKILTDPACAHDDKITVVAGAGGIPASLQASAERHCPAASSSPTPASAAATDSPPAAVR